MQAMPTPAPPLPWLVVTTVGTKDEALRLAHAVVEQRLAACAQIEALTSVYRWQGAIHEDAEFRLLCKTSAERTSALLDTLRALHPYTLPALHAWPVALADPAYTDWVLQSTRQVGAGAGSANPDDPADLSGTRLPDSVRRNP